MKLIFRYIRSNVNFMQIFITDHNFATTVAHEAN